MILETLNAFHGINRALERAINIPSNGAKSHRKAAGIQINIVVRKHLLLKIYYFLLFRELKVQIKSQYLVS
jgi:hypothetical protein